MVISRENLLVDGQRLGKVLSFQITSNEANEQNGTPEENVASVFYITDGGDKRHMTCGLEAISFGSSS